VEIEEKEVLNVEKNLATQQHTRRRRSRFVVQGELGTSIERLSFTILDLRETEKQSSLPQSDCLQSETWKTLLDHDALLCSIMQWSLDTTVDACLKGILFPRDKNLFVKVENFLNGMDHSRRIGISDAEISPPFMSQEKSLDRQQSSQQKL
jgi:hypothetical protein